MKTSQVLYLGSSSQSRQMLLKQARIPFTLVTQSADEAQCDWKQGLKDVVTSIALHKMAHCQLPAGKEGDTCFVLTADTLTQDSHGVIQGKPADATDAIAKLKAVRDGVVTTGTAFCLEKKLFKGGSWVMQEQIIGYAQAEYLFQVPDAWLDAYLADSLGLSGSGAIGIEEYGNLFLKALNGSYSAVIGLPLFELRQALEKLGFFS